MNTVTPVVTHLFQCNTDITSFFSKPAIKAVVAYVSDYILKTSLETHVVFDTIQSVFNKNSEMIEASLHRKEKARCIITKIVNSLTSKMEIGALMASLYLLGNPDHYTNNKFVLFYWKSYMQEERYGIYRITMIHLKNLKI